MLNLKDLKKIHAKYGEADTGSTGKEVEEAFNENFERVSQSVNDLRDYVSGYGNYPFLFSRNFGNENIANYIISIKAFATNDYTDWFRPNDLLRKFSFCNFGDPVEGNKKVVIFRENESGDLVSWSSKEFQEEERILYFTNSGLTITIQIKGWPENRMYPIENLNQINPQIFLDAIQNQEIQKSYELISELPSHSELSGEFLYAILDQSGKNLFSIKQDGTVYIPNKEFFDSSTHSEFLYVKTDVDGKLLFGIRRDGTPYFPHRLLLESESDEEFLYSILDGSGRILLAIRKDSTLYIPNQELLRTSIDKEFLHVIMDEQGKNLFAIRKDGALYSPLHPQNVVTDSSEFLYAITDSQGYVISGIRRDGSVYNPSESSGVPINNNYYTESIAIQLAIPTSVARVDIDVNLGLLTTSKNSVNCNLEYRDNTGVYFSKPASIAYQGSSSMNFIKKNFSIDLYNDESRTENCKIKFGDWVPQDSFHLKAYYIDSMLARDPVCNRLWHQIIESRPYDNRYPYQIPYTYGWRGQEIPDSNQTLDQRFLSSGARCHVDGFPVEIYIRGEYWGLYVWRLKKHRDNYMMDKSNQNNILMELSGRTYLQLYKTIIYPSIDSMNTITPDNDEGCFVDNGDGTYDLYYSPYSTETHIWRKLGTKTSAQMEVIHTDEELPYTMEVKWERWEVRNPKIDAIWQKGDEFEPVECKAKRNIYSFLEWCNKYTASTITREEIETHLNVSFCIDFYLFCEFVHAWDLRVKNALYGTYDGVIWQPYPYDLDCVFGSSASGKFRGDNPNTVTTNTQIPIQFVQARYGDEFKSRYAELKSRGIFNVENVISLFMDFTNLIGTDLYQKNFDRWPAIPSEKEDAYFSIGQIGAWIKDRITYMDKKYLN